jgi:hypothetical protein
MGEQEIDSQLKEMLDLLRPVPRRSSDALRRSRSRFYADLDVYFPVEAAYNSSLKAPSARSAGTSARFKPLLLRPAFTYLAVVVIVFFALFGGGYVTASAANTALPGDALYPIKLDLEQARVSLTRNRARQAELHLEFAQRRMDEINALSDLGRYERVGPLTKQFNHQLELALGAVQVLKNLQPDEAARLNDQVTDALARFQVTINRVVTNAPTTLRQGLQETINQAGQVTPPVDNTRTNNGIGSGSSNANNNPANPNPGNANNNGNPSPGNNNSNPNSNPNGAPGSGVNGNNSDHAPVNPGNNRDKTKNSNNGNGKGKDDDKENNGKNK